MITFGLDVARVRDFSARAALEPWKGRQAIVHLAVWRPEREDCSDAVLPVIDWLGRNAAGTRARIAIDGRGRQGEAVVRAAVGGALGAGADVYALLPSHSDEPHRQRSDGWIYVGKDPLVATLRDGLASGALFFAAGVTGADVLRHQIERLARVATRRGKGTTWSHPDQRRGSHDDLVMAAAYGYWLANLLETRGQAVLPLGRY